MKLPEIAPGQVDRRYLDTMAYPWHIIGRPTRFGSRRYAGLAGTIEDAARAVARLKSKGWFDVKVRAA